MYRLVSRLLFLMLAMIPLRAAEPLNTKSDFEDEVVGASGSRSINLDRWGRFSTADPMGLEVAQDPLTKNNQALRIRAREELGAYQGIFQKLPVREGQKYRFSVKVINDKTAPLLPGTSGLLSVEWRNADGNEVARQDGPTWGANLSDARWESIEMDTRAPEQATEAHFVVMQKNSTESSKAPGGAFLLDDFAVQEK